MNAAITLTLDDEESGLVAAEAAAAAGILPEPLAAQANELARIAPDGTVPAALLDILERVASASLEGGRARRLYRAEGEKILNRVLSRTPAGQTSAAELAQINQALTALEGRRIDGVVISTRSPGNHTVRIATEGVSLSLAIGSGGVAVQSVTA